MATIAQNLNRIENAKKELGEFLMGKLNRGIRVVPLSGTIDEWYNHVKYAIKPYNQVLTDYRLFKYECAIPIIYRGRGENGITVNFYTTAAYPTVTICHFDGRVIAQKMQHYTEGAYGVVTFHFSDEELIAGDIGTGYLDVCFENCDALISDGHFYPTSIEGNLEKEGYCYARGYNDYRNELKELGMGNIYWSYNTTP